MATTPFFGSATVHPFAPSATKPWHKACQATRHGDPLPVLHNVLLALRGDPAFNGKLGYDEMLRCVTVNGEPVTDDHQESIHEWMQANGIRRVALETVCEAIRIEGRKHPFHPVRDWMDALQWDGTPRLAEWLPVYIGTASDEYHRQIGTCFLKSMAARIYEPGCKVDYMLVLEGPQRTLKSSVCRTLGGKWFSDTLPDLGVDMVRVSMHLRGKLLIEISELSAISRAESARLKAFMSSPEEQYVPKHARQEVIEPRQCVFIGTTNDDQYLKDPTGGSRFWPVKCGTITLDKLIADREQLFAEAVSEYQRTKRWWPDTAIEQQLISPIQEMRYEADAWDEPILAYLLGRSTLTLTQLADEALGLKKDRLGQADARRMASILRQSGWKQHKGTGGARYWVAP